MIEHAWSIACARSSTDKETNNLSIFDVIEQLNVLGPLPDPATKSAVPITYEIVSLWYRADPKAPEETVGRIRLVGPNEAEVFGQEFPVNLIDHPRMRTQLRSLGFPMLGAGRYMFLVEIRRNNNLESAARIPVQLESVAQPTAAPVA